MSERQMATFGSDKVADLAWIDFLESGWIELVACMRTETNIEVYVYITCWIRTAAYIKSSKGQLFATHPAYLTIAVTVDTIFNAYLARAVLSSLGFVSPCGTLSLLSIVRFA